MVCSTRGASPLVGLPIILEEQDLYYAGWYWPHKPKGIVKNRVLPKVQSKFKYEWRVEEGKAYSGSEFLGDSAIRLLLWSPDLEELTKDMNYLEKFYNPVEIR